MQKSMVFTLLEFLIDGVSYIFTFYLLPFLLNLCPQFRGMQISYRWLSHFIQHPLEPNALAKVLTHSGLEVEEVNAYESIRGGLSGFVVGKVLSCVRHPNADKLSKTTVDVGTGTPLAIVCGAPNVAAGQTVVVATVGTQIYPIQGDPFVIKKAKIRGEESEGMICAEDEMGMGTSHEGILVLQTDYAPGTPAASVFGLETDHVLSIGLTPNRIDAASHWGVAREIRALLHNHPELKSTFHKKFDLAYPKTCNTEAYSALPAYKITVENPKACPRYMGVLLENVQVGPSPEWLQHLLKSIGVNPINNVVDITNYILHDLGQPLHAFDADAIAGNEVIIKTLAAGTTFVSLDKTTRTLQDFDLMICDAEKPMCLAGVFGGLHSGVHINTKRIFLESAYFSPDFVRKTAQHHGLKTDASFRFERGTDPQMPPFALQKAIDLLIELCGAQVASSITDIYPNPIQGQIIEVTFQEIDDLIGVSLDRTTICSILEDLSIELLEENEKGLKVQVPAFRVDVQRPADLVEEIVRIYGFDCLPVPNAIGSKFLADYPDLFLEEWKEKTASMLVGSGFFELMTNSLTNPLYHSFLPEELQSKSVKILNKLSEELSEMRQSMLFTGLEALQYNVNRRQKDLKFFEFGRTYQLQGNANEAVGYVENQVLALYMHGFTQSEHYSAPQKNTQFVHLATEVQKILFSLGIKPLEEEKIASDALFAYGITLKKGQQIAVKMGKVQTKICKHFDLKSEVWYAEINIQVLMKSIGKSVQYKEVTKFPEVRRDLSLVIDQQVSFAKIVQLAKKTEKNLLTEINVFDVYQGDKIDAGKKAYSVSFQLCDTEKTLTDQQIDLSMERLISAFEKELGALIRR